MTSAAQSRSNLTGAFCALAAALCFSFNDMGIKLVSGDYALHQVVFIRSIVAMITFLAIIMPLSGGWQVLRTRRLGMHILRGSCVVIANSMLFLGLAALPIADAVAIYFIQPLAVALLSILFLGERVGPRRWLGIGIGLTGVLLIVKPGTSAFQIASLLPAGAAFFYAMMNIVARKIGPTESAATMAFYILVIFIIVSGGIGLAVGDGRYAGTGHPSLEFLLRAWGPVQRADLPMLIMLGVTGVFGGFLIGQAYRLSEAAFAAPFEYVAMVMAIFWGITVFGTWPDHWGWAGMGLILGAGLYLVWRETRKTRHIPPSRRSA